MSCLLGNIAAFTLKTPMRPSRVCLSVSPLQNVIVCMSQKFIMKFMVCRERLVIQPLSPADGKDKVEKDGENRRNGCRDVEEEGEEGREVVRR